MFYFECTYRRKSKWLRNIPAHPQSDSSHCTNVSSFPASNRLSPTHPRRPGRHEGQSQRRRFVFWRGVWESFDQCCQTHATETIKPNTHTQFTTAGFQREGNKQGINRIWHDSSSESKRDPQWPIRNSPEDTASVNPQTWVKTQKSPLKHFHSYTRHDNGRTPVWNARLVGLWAPGADGLQRNDWGKPNDKMHDIHEEGPGPVLCRVL